MARMKRGGLWLSAFIALVLLSGCATTKAPISLSIDHAGKMRSLAVATDCAGGSLVTLDITGIRSRLYSRGSWATGSLLAALETEATIQKEIDTLIGGSVEPVSESIRDFDARSTVDTMMQELSERLKTKTYIEKVVMVKWSDLPSLSWYDANGRDLPDAMLLVDYQYGIGGLGKDYPVPAIVANVSIKSVPRDEILMSDKLVSFSCAGKGYTLADYARDGGRIYRECFRQAAGRLVLMIADLAFPRVRPEPDVAGDSEERP